MKSCPVSKISVLHSLQAAARKEHVEIVCELKMMNVEKTVSYGTTYSLSAETVGTFEILCVVNSVA